jgi:hypothetical protein
MGIKCSQVSVRGCKHGFFCSAHFVEHKEATIGKKDIDSSFYEEVLKLKSARGKEIRAARKDQTKQVLNSSTFFPMFHRHDHTSNLSRSHSLFQLETPDPVHAVTVTLTASDVMLEQNSVVPFALLPKTQKQRLKIVTMVLGPPPGRRDDLVALQKEISESSTPSPS